MKITLRLASATLAAGTALASLSMAPPLVASAACDPATHAIQYLAAHQSADGSIDQSLAETADMVLGAAADGIDPNTLKALSGKNPYDFFAADLGTGSPKAFTDANQLGKLIQAVVTGHHDPTSFAGKDLVAKLTSSPMYSGGVFNDGAGGANQAFTQSQAILALVAAGDSGFGGMASSVTELKSLRSTSGATKGGWQAFGTFDSNTTSMALMALHAAGDTATNDSTTYNDAFGYLHTQQDPASGGFTFSTDFGTASDPDSDALVIQALTAAGQDPTSASWTNTKGNAPTDILSFQDAASGGFVFAHGGKLQNFASSQVAAGILRAPFPVTGTYTSGATMPAVGCPAATGQTSPAAAPGLPAAGFASAKPQDAIAAVVAAAAVLVTALAATAVWPTAPRRR